MSRLSNVQVVYFALLQTMWDKVRSMMTVRAAETIIFLCVCGELLTITYT